MDWINYNPDKTLAGLEARYRIKDNELQIEMCGANHKKDWYKSIFVKSITRWGYKVNKYYYYMALRLFRHLKNEYDLLEIRTVIMAHSMGGAVGELYKKISMDRNYAVIDVAMFGSPRSGIPCGYININKGEIAHLWPFWYPKYIIEYYINKKWQWFWKAHSSYNWRFER